MRLPVSFGHILIISALVCDDEHAPGRKSGRKVGRQPTMMLKGNSTLHWSTSVDIRLWGTLTSSISRSSQHSLKSSMSNVKPRSMYRLRATHRSDLPFRKIEVCKLSG